MFLAGQVEVVGIGSSDERIGALKVVNGVVKIAMTVGLLVIRLDILNKDLVYILQVSPDGEEI
jgi:hypothetical protein